jgi:hypothetical protein
MDLKVKNINSTWQIMMRRDKMRIVKHHPVNGKGEFLFGVITYYMLILFMANVA